MSNPYSGLTGEKKMGKAAIGSRLNWVGIITTIVSLGTYFKGSELIANNPTLVSVAGMVVGIGTIILRVITKEPITGVVKAKEEDNG